MLEYGLFPFFVDVLSVLRQHIRLHSVLATFQFEPTYYARLTRHLRLRAAYARLMRGLRAAYALLTRDLRSDVAMTTMSS